MKTAMQNVIDYLQEMLDDDFDSRTKYIQELCEKSLEKEKQQIIESHNKGQQFYNSGYNPDTSEKYYSETFD